MTTNAETRVQGQGENLSDPHERLRRSLPYLTGHNALFVNLMLEHYGRSNKLGGVLESLAELADLSTTPQAVRRQKERQSAQRADIMEIIEPFNSKERIVIAKNLGAVQMTDGCTVGCAWCGVEAKRGVRTSFSGESYRRFIREFGKYIPKTRTFGLYEASDPFDWVSEDGKGDYGSLVRYFLENTGSKSIFTSTAVPVGSEISVALFLIEYINRSVADAQKGRRSLEGFRFSVTKDNKVRISKIMQFIKSLKRIPEDNLKEFIELVERSEEMVEDDVKSNGEKEAMRSRIGRIGYFVHKPDRSDDDIDGTACQDSLILSPFHARTIRGEKVRFGGIVASLMEAVTLQNSKGERSFRVLPGIMEIPVCVDGFRYMFPYEFTEWTRFPILPKHAYDVYRDGELIESKVEESVRRDALTFYWAYLNLIRWVSSMKGEEKVDDPNAGSCTDADAAFYKDLAKFILEFGKRRKSCTALFDSESDKEAVDVAKRYIQKIEDWIVDLAGRIQKSAKREAVTSSNSLKVD